MSSTALLTKIIDVTADTAQFSDTTGMK